MPLTIIDARDICHPPRISIQDAPGPQDATLDLAEYSIGDEMARQAEQERVANVEMDYREASYALEGAAINLRAYVRGMVRRDVLPVYFKEARDAIDRMEAVVNGGAL